MVLPDLNCTPPEEENENIPEENQNIHEGNEDAGTPNWNMHEHEYHNYCLYTICMLLSVILMFVRIGKIPQMQIQFECCCIFL